MNDNSIMRLAQRNKKDEFYTRREDINVELNLYREQFENKNVFLPCDSEDSEFVKFFAEVICDWNIKEVRAVCWSSNQLTTKEIIIQKDKTFVRPIDDNGDLRTSQYIRKTIGEWADIIVTNPPFSLFREFMTMVLESNKQFCIIGNMNQILTKDLLHYVADEKMWFGPSIHSGDRAFRVPDDYPLDATGTFVENEQKFIKVKGVRWFTNMKPDIEDKRKTFVPTISVNDMQFDRFDYMPDIICVNRTQDIPYDFDGLMGVPLTYFDKHNSELFEIVDGVNRYLVLDSLGINNEAKRNKWHLLTVNGEVKFFRFLIKRKINT